MSTPPGALRGLRVLDLTRYIPGPAATMLLGDLGADVVKVEEPPLGDATRALPPLVDDGESAAHASLNRNKRSIVLDLRTEDGAAAVRRLAATVDVLVEAFRPGTLARRGLGPGALLDANPRLVYCSITGYGQDGPHAARAGHDVSYLSRAGFLGLNRDRDGRPTMPAAQVADMAGAYVAVVGILAALHARERTGRGQHVDVSLLRASLGLVGMPLARHLAGSARADELSGAYACYNVYRCRDGRYVSVGALEPKFWEGLCRALDRPDLVGRQWHGGDRGRDTVASLAAIFSTRDRDDWVRALGPKDVCVEPVLDLDEVASDPVASLALLDQPQGRTTLRTVGPPLRLADTPPSVRCGAPALGAQTSEVLAEAGFRPDEIERLGGGAVA